MCTIYAFLVHNLLTIVTAQSYKRGIAYLGNTHAPDNFLLTRDTSPLSWYYNWSPNPPPELSASELEFTPLIHGLYDAQDPQTKSNINSLPENSRHLLSFNEPDGTTDSGGSSISPEDAAKAYVEHIAPYRVASGRIWNISHPSVTGSPRGLKWLRDFNASCFEIDKQNGCAMDFIAAHWYGAFAGLQGWLSSLDEFYNRDRSEGEKLKIWVTEMALPQADAMDTVRMMNETLPYLDGLDYVERYAWFGAFRAKDANQWTGDGVALFGDDGALTQLGALYLNGKEGEKGQGKDNVSSNIHMNGVLVLLWLVSNVVLGGYWE